MSASRGNRLGPAVAGTWYPSDPVELRERVGGMLRGQPVHAGGGPTRAVIAPHAGFAYSGNVAAAVFSRLAGQRKTRVVLIGPSHYESFDGAAVPESGRYVTPLGEVAFDLPALDALGGRPGLHRTDRPFLPEHSLEAELPFLQESLADGWRLIPVLIGAGASPERLAQIADALRPELTPETLIVVSSDFTHYGRRFGYVPFTDDIPRRIRELDLGAVELVLAGDRDGFRRYVNRTGATICGRHAIEVLLRLLPAASQGDLGAYDTSGNMTGTWDLSVSYAGVVFGACPADIVHG